MSEFALQPAARSALARPVWPLMLLLGFAALSLAPVALVDVPAMVDYPNHLARMSVLARAGTRAASPFYDVTWALYPNLGMDLLVPPLARLVGTVPATRLFYLASQILIVSGAMALSFAVRRQCLAAGLVACALLYCVPFAWGFVNFEFGLGLALWGMAGWIALARGPALPRLALHGLLVVMLYASHLFALGIYGFTIGVWELWRARAERRGARRALATLAGMAAPALLVAGATLAMGVTVGGSGTGWAFGQKLVWLFSLNGFSREISLVVTATLALLAYALARKGFMRFVGGGVALLAAYAALFIVMPFVFLDTAFVDVRVPAAAALILPAFLVIEIPDARWRRAAAILAGTGALANLAAVAWIQAGYRSDYAALYASFDRLPRQARILIATEAEAEDPPVSLAEYPMYHAPTLAVDAIDAFVPTLFTYPGKQPIRPKPAYRDIAVSQGGPIEVAILAAIAAGEPHPHAPDYVRDWTHDFDAVYVLRGSGRNPLPNVLEPAVAGRRFTLFRVRTAKPRATSP